MRNRTPLLLYVAIAVNIALALLPTYDAANIRSWIALGSTITSAAPAMMENIWPGGFFSFMVFTPMYLAYVFSEFNVYLAVVVLKLILFIFTLLTAFLLYRITQKIKPAYADFILLFTLLNPAIIYINYFWAQLDILPVFFFTLGYAILRYVDFKGNNLKRYMLGFFPIMISTFIYRYPLILVPALVLYDYGSLRQKTSMLLIAIGQAAALFGAEYLLYRGGTYNYVSALSGEVINMSGIQGFQYWIGIPQIPYLILLLALGIAVPLILKRFTYREFSTLFVVLLLFIYTSAVPLPDYLLWIYPLGVFIALTSMSHLSLKNRLLLTGLPLYVGLFFISFIIGNGVQTGLFFFAHPLLRQDVAFFTTPESYSSFVFVFNIFLLASVIIASIFSLSKSNRVSSAPESEGAAGKLWIARVRFSRRTKALLAALLAVFALLSVGFNSLYAQPTVASNNGVFPLYLFPANNSYDTYPMSQTYYLSWNGLVVYNNWSTPITFNHALNLKDINLSLSYNLQADYYGDYTLLKADNYTAGISIKPTYSLSNLTAINPLPPNQTVQSLAQTPFFDQKTPVYRFAPSSSINYSLDNPSNDYYIVAFKLTNGSLPQSLLFHFKNSQFILDYSVSDNAAWLFCYDLQRHNSTHLITTYSGQMVDGWNIAVFKTTLTGFYSWLNNVPLFLNGTFFNDSTDLKVGSYYHGNRTSQAGGQITQLYTTSNTEAPDAAFYLAKDSNIIAQTPLKSSNLTLTFTTNSNCTTITVDSKSYTIQPINWLSFGKITSGAYGLSFILTNMTLSQKNSGYYLIPVYFAVLVPFAVAIMSLPLILRRRENGSGWTWR